MPVNEQKGGIKDRFKPGLMLLDKCNRRHLRRVFCWGGEWVGEFGANFDYSDLKITILPRGNGIAFCGQT